MEHAPMSSAPSWMSGTSRCSCTVGTVGDVGRQALEDLVGDPSLERSDRVALGVAAFDRCLDVVMARPGAALLGDRDPMDRGVDLPVAPRLSRNRSCALHRCSAVPSGERGT